MAKSRTEIDKELMYRKIMPSAAKKPVLEETAGSESSEQERILSAAAAPASVPSAAAMASSIHRSAVAVPFKDSDTVLVNLMEDMVFEKLDATLLRFNCCKCNKCRKDIAALALNRLKPRYVVMEKNDKERRRKAEEEFGSEVTGALVQAILIVKKDPRH